MLFKYVFIIFANLEKWKDACKDNKTKACYYIGEFQMFLQTKSEDFHRNSCNI